MATTCFIDGDLTIYQASEQCARLLGVLEHCDTLELDLAGVSEIDTAGIQILVLLKQSASAAGKALRLVAHSPAVIEVFDLLRLAPFFGDDVVIHA